mmetsp:Transcript_14542/g.22432  ORF Transcript_14542/g.22432 Transcript_14542/m.22432 type:complete len:169 (+) Transcript_14542:198-704(+)
MTPRFIFPMALDLLKLIWQQNLHAKASLALLIHVPSYSSKRICKKSIIQVSTMVLTCWLYMHTNLDLSHQAGNERKTGKINRYVASKKPEISSLPMRCPNATTLQRMYDCSLKFQKSVLVAENTTQQMLDFDLGWKQALGQQKFCTWDVKDIVKKKEWKQFFSEFESF